MKKINKKGFTLIEVVLVLAIGGLIFLLAFLAFQQASKNRRDTQRRSDAGRVVSEIANYSGDNSGSIPTTSAGASGAAGAAGTFNAFLTTYMGGGNFKDPSGNTYESILPATAFDTTKPYQMKYTPGDGSAKACDNSSVMGTKDYKVEVQLEKGIACRDSGK